MGYVTHQIPMPLLLDPSQKASKQILALPLLGSSPTCLHPATHSKLTVNPAPTPSASAYFPIPLTMPSSRCFSQSLLLLTYGKEKHLLT